VYFDGGNKANLYCILTDRCKKFDNRFGLLNHLKEHWVPRRYYTQAASIESVSLRLLGVTRGPLWHGTRLEEIGQIGLKPALCILRKKCTAMPFNCGLTNAGGRLALSVKSWPHNCEAGVRSPSPVVPLSKEPSTEKKGDHCGCKGKSRGPT